MDTKPTPGPMHYERTGKNTGTIRTGLPDAGGRVLAEIHWRGFIDGNPSAEAEKDATGHAMAATTALLNALVAVQEAEALVRQGSAWGQAMATTGANHLVPAALAKAKGGG